MLARRRRPCRDRFKFVLIYPVYDRGAFGALYHRQEAMAINDLISGVCARLHAFCSAQRGNVAITFGLAVIPIFGIVGMAVDYSRANSARSAMQAALDSAALMLSKEAATLTSAQVTQKGSDYFKAVFNRPEALEVQITSTYDSTAGTLTMTGSAQVDTTVARVLGQTQLPISGLTQVVSGAKKLELALVLDNSGSMNGSNKLDELKSATHQLLDTLKKAAQNPGDVRVAIVPFANYVKIGTAYKTKPWLDWRYMNNNGGGGDQCGYDHREDGGSPASWTGCVNDRDQPYDIQDTTPTNDPATWYPALNCKNAAIQPLTSDWTALNAKVDQMAAYGTTNLTIGMVWGWHALTPNEPLTEGTAPLSGIAKYIVVLSDGSNTENRWWTDSAKVNARTTALCTNIKAAGIKIYTVRVMDGNAALMQTCASGSNMYSSVTQASQISTVFAAIARDLTTLRITR